MSLTDRLYQTPAAKGEVERRLAEFSDQLLAMGYAVIKVDEVLDDWQRQSVINISNEQNERRRKHAKRHQRQTDANALSPQQLEEQRAKIGLRVDAILDQFWRSDDTPEATQILELEGWCDVLENCTHDEIRRAWATYQKMGPRTQSGKLYKPDAGAIYKNVMASRPKPKVVTDTIQGGVMCAKPVEYRSWPINPEKQASSERIFREVAEKLSIEKENSQ